MRTRTLMVVSLLALAGTACGASELDERDVAPSDLASTDQDPPLDADPSPVDGDSDTSPGDTGADVEAPAGDTDVLPVLPLDPAATGPCEYTTESAQVPTSSGTSVPVVLYVPSVASRVPAVVISHGFSLAASLYASYAERLARWCYVAVLNDYPSGFTGPSHAVMAGQLADVVGWLSSAGSPVASRIESDKVGLVGHSLGAKLGFLLHADALAEVHALVALDPVDAGSPSLAPERVDETTVPTLLLGETYSGDNAVWGQSCAPLAENFQQYYAALPGGLPTVEVDFARAQHMSWLDDPNCGLSCLACSSPDDVDHAGVHARSQKYMVAWFERYLRGRTVMDAALTGAGMSADVATGAQSMRTK